MFKYFISYCLLFSLGLCLTAEPTVPTKEVSSLVCDGCPSTGSADFLPQNCVFKYSDFKFNGHYENTKKGIKVSKFIYFDYICRTENPFNIKLTISNKTNRFDSAYFTSFQIDTGVDVDDANNFNVPVQSQMVFFRLPEDTRFETSIGLSVSDKEFQTFVDTFELFKDDDFDMRTFKLEELQKLDFIISRLQYKMIKEKTFIAENQKIRLIFEFPILTKAN